MLTRVLQYHDSFPTSGPMLILTTDQWDDFGYKTTFHATYIDANANSQSLGIVKIARFGSPAAHRRTELPKAFDSLPGEYFSLGQDADYYRLLNDLGSVIRDDILRTLNDVALDLDLFSRALKEDVMGVSLLRSLSTVTVRNQFHRLALGGVPLTPFSFTYHPPSVDDAKTPGFVFDVQPDSRPPTNIQVLVGRNGVGKTRLLHMMAQTLVDPESIDFGHFVMDGKADSHPFANLVSVSFSAFDEFEPLSEPRNRASALPYSYLGLKWKTQTPEGKTRAPKSPQDLSREFVDSVKLCSHGARLDRWKRALATLETDPIFADASIASLSEAKDVESSGAATTFRELSSGHKIVLLTVTRLVETVVERTLILLDEPEAHLHPPLLSSFIRALSDLLIDRNGVAIIATHSPVVLQEVPASCVWKIRRSGSNTSIDRPDIETFGENVGILTREVFGLEVTQSGFHRMLWDLVARGVSFESLVSMFDGNLGGEALALARAMIEARQADASG